MTGLELLKERHSVRSYSSEPLEDAVRNRLRSEVTYINSHEAGLNLQLCFDDDGPFKGFARSYGMFRNVSNYLAVVIDPTFPDAYERAGYFSEQFAIECVKGGLGSCFVGGTFSREHISARVEVYEKVPYVMAFGIPETSKTTFMGKFTAKMAHRKIRAPRDFFDGTDSEYKAALAEFPWLITALEAVACAPSALNKQPVRLHVIESEGIKHIAAKTIDPEKYAVELGIAKFNVATTVSGVWDWGDGGIFYCD